MNNPLLVVPLVTLVSLLGTGSQTCLKKAVTGAASGSGVWTLVLRAVVSPWAWAAVAFASIAGVVWLFVLSRAELSYASPFFSIGFPLLLATSYFLLGEPVTALRVVGTLVITVGMLMVAMS